LGGKIYIAEMNGPGLALPDITTAAKVDPQAISKPRCVAARILVKEYEVDLDNAESNVHTVEGLCFRPVTPTGHTLVVRVPEGTLGQGIETQGVSVGGVYGKRAWTVGYSFGDGDKDGVAGDDGKERESEGAGGSE